MNSKGKETGHRARTEPPEGGARGHAADAGISLGSARVGILGGGQLARMLAESAFRLGLQPLILAQDSDDPAAQLCPGAALGGWKDPTALARFLSQVGLVIFENEFVSKPAIEAAAAQFSTTRVRFVPSLEALALLQDKLNQKALLQRCDIPAPEFESYEKGPVKAWVSRVFERFGGECVFKWATLGYDGKGTWISGGGRTQADATRFCEDALERGVRVFVERKIAFEREVAIIACHSVQGEIATYPLVASRQEDGICKLVTGPAAPGSAVEKRATDFAQRIARAVPLHGTFAIEMFETREGDLLVNELAPRVHNSGHYTQDASDTSQFENHWRAVLGLPLGSTRSEPAFAMLNLLGHRDHEGALPMPSCPARTHLHWYGKREMRRGRKMGHLNASAEAGGELDSLVRELEAVEREWIAKGESS